MNVVERALRNNVLMRALVDGERRTLEDAVNEGIDPDDELGETVAEGDTITFRQAIDFARSYLNLDPYDWGS